MIVISCYNPDTPRSVTDEELLTTLLASLIRHRVANSSLKVWAKEQAGKEYYEIQVRNCDIIIKIVHPLLGLDITEVIELIEAQK